MTTSSNNKLEAASASTTSQKADTSSDSDLSDDTVSSSDGSFKLPVLSDYAKKVLLTDPLNKNRLGQTTAPSSSTPNNLSIPASTSSPLRQFGTTAAAGTSQSNSSIIGNMSPTLATTRKQYKSQRASPINGSRQQHEVQRHLNRIRQGMKSQTEDELNSIRTSANNTNNNINNGVTGSKNNTSASTSSTNSSNQTNLPNSHNSVDMSHSASPSLHHNNIMNDSLSKDQNDIQHNTSTDKNNSTNNINTPRKNLEQYHSLPSPTLDQSEKSFPFHTMTRKTASNQTTTQDTNIAPGYSTPAITRANSTRTNLTTIRVKRVGRSLGPPKRAVPRGSDEGLNEHGEFPEESDRNRANKIRFAPTRADSTFSPPVSTSAEDIEMTDSPIDDSPMPDADVEFRGSFENDRKSDSPLPRELNPLKTTTNVIPNNIDEINVSEAARKRRSELYEVAERAHTIFDEDNQNNPNSNHDKSPKEIERQQTLERQHEELRHQLMIQEQQIKQRKQLVEQIPLPKISSPPMSQPQQISSIVNEPIQHHQQYMPINESQQLQQQMSSSREGRKTKSTIYVNGQAYQRLELIGRGGSSKVYKVQSNNGKVYAIKRVSCDDDIDHMVLKGFKGEIDLLQRLNDEDRVVKLIDYEMRMSSIYVVMECGEIDLAHVLSARLSQPLDISFVRYYANEMLHCVAAVHRHDIVHSDLKPANFLLVKGMLKIIDFGIANVVPDYTSNVHRDTQIGTPNYMAPEALLDANSVYTTGSKSNEDSNINKRNSIISLNNSSIYAPSSKPEPSKFKVGRPSDVWSCGCIIYQMIYGRPPYGGYQGTQRMFAIMNPKVRISYPKNGLGHVRVPKEAIEAIKGCLDRDPTQRMTIEQAMNGSFLNPQAVDRNFIQDLLVHAVKYGAERGSAVNERELEMLTDNVWKKIQATNL